MTDHRPPLQDVANRTLGQVSIVKDVDGVVVDGKSGRGQSQCSDGDDDSSVHSVWSEHDREHMARMLRAAVRQSTRSKADARSLTAELQTVQARRLTASCTL